ncbi:hypothetical protein [Arthrobacter celericrescens]|uniref:hypothetical protein n=1 Tax=Arthrobacter celericrescens TaxID=2320851 RepID=UPI000EA1129F|nr:hypothetical protein [Arthrobacter celericrescens]
MMDSKIVRLHKLWTNFAADRRTAQGALQERLDKYDAAIGLLREEIIRAQTQFDDHWKNRKPDIQKQRDDAVMEELATGRSAQSILRELGSNNTKWIYDLRARVADRIPEQTNVNSRPQPQDD